MKWKTIQVAVPAMTPKQDDARPEEPTEPLSTDELRFLRKIIEGATPGPWEVEDPHDGACWSSCTENGCPEDHPTGTFEVLGPGYTDEGDRIWNFNDAILMACARDFLPRMLHEIETLRARVAELETEQETS